MAAPIRGCAPYLRLSSRLMHCPFKSSMFFSSSGTYISGGNPLAYDQACELFP